MEELPARHQRKQESADGSTRSDADIAAAHQDAKPHPFSLVYEHRGLVKHQTQHYVFVTGYPAARNIATHAVVAHRRHKASVPRMTDVQPDMSRAGATLVRHRLGAKRPRTLSSVASRRSPPDRCCVDRECSLRTVIRTWPLSGVKDKRRRSTHRQPSGAWGRVLEEIKRLQAGPLTFRPRSAISGNQDMETLLRSSPKRGRRLRELSGHGNAFDDLLPGLQSKFLEVRSV